MGQKFEYSYINTANVRVIFLLEKPVKPFLFPLRCLLLATLYFMMSFS